MHVHISGRQNKNKLKEKHEESSEQASLSSHQFTHQFHICEFWKKIWQTVVQHSDVQIENQLLLYNFIVYHQRNGWLRK